MTPSPTQMTPNTEWEENFDKRYGGLFGMRLSIKTFIRSLLAAQRKELIEKFVAGLPEEIKRSDGTSTMVVTATGQYFLDGQHDGFVYCRSQTLENWKKAGLI